MLVERERALPPPPPPSADLHYGDCVTKMTANDNNQYGNGIATKTPMTMTTTMMKTTKEMTTTVTKKTTNVTRLSTT